MTGEKYATVIRRNIPTAIKCGVRDFKENFSDMGVKIIPENREKIAIHPTEVRKGVRIYELRKNKRSYFDRVIINSLVSFRINITPGRKMIR